jgi:DNA gyrase subunit B
MTDADVDGSHIRTLILTFLYRNMPELFDHDHVYIAVPPLYKVKLGNQEFYFEKDAQLEELLVRERIGDFEILDRHGEAVKLSPHKWGQFVRALTAFEGWAGRLRADFGGAAEFLVKHRLVELNGAVAKNFGKALGAVGENGYSLELESEEADTFRVKVIEKETSALERVDIPHELLASGIYQSLRDAYSKLADLVGLPPFTISHNKKTRLAETYQALRHEALDLAKEGIQLSRFKGLGEMNEDQLWETTMDPQRRLLVRVQVEDEIGAGQLFSMLMGDQVEPRRLFIEENAKDVRFLDV